MQTTRAFALVRVVDLAGRLLNHSTKVSRLNRIPAERTINTRPTVQRMPELSTPVIATLYEAGATAADIAEQFGTTRQTVSRHLSKAGNVKRRGGVRRLNDDQPPKLLSHTVTDGASPSSPPRTEYLQAPSATN
ncbi:MAG: helix-turn-helix transcriptional regulator [Actinomycetia bacterium]|nr:helix-turn-helix transcriptional regulator [Actinomycetes bacterium]